jgi:hypothetical protein
MMMRRSLCALALLAAASVQASAQMPPNIQKPIDAARRQANKTSAQINNEQKVGNDPGTKAASMPAPQAAPQSAAQKGAPAASARQGAASKQAVPPTKTAAPVADTAQKRGSVTQNGSKTSVTFYRETFNYESDGRRDPFLSLMATGELRPMISDLTLVGIIYDESGRNSVAILVDASAGGQTYRRKVGDVLGRMKITKISENDITLNVDEFGFSRQETLLIDRNPRTGARRP